MSALLNDIKKTIKEKVIDENFKSDDGVSEVPDPEFAKGPDTPGWKGTKNPAEKSNSSEDNTKIQKDNHDADDDNKKDINHKKLKQVNEDDDDDDSNDDDGATTKTINLNKGKKDDDDDDDDGSDDNSSDDEDEDGDIDIKVRKVRKEDIDIDEHLVALFGEEKLTKSFKSRAKTIFETAVITAANKVVDEVVQDINEAREANEEAYLETMVERLDGYLDKVVAEWLEENRVEVQRNVRTEIAESFLVGLKKLFEDHYIEIEEDKVDVVSELVERCENLQSQLDEEIESNVELARALTESRKNTIISESLYDLSDNQKSKLKTLVEGIDYVNDEDFSEKLDEVKKAYFTETVRSTANYDDDDLEILSEEEEIKTSTKEVTFGTSVAADLARLTRKI